MTGLDLFDAMNEVVLGAFGEPTKFTLIRAGEAPVEDLDGIFDARHFAADAGGEVPVSERQTTLSCRLADIGDAAAGDAVEVRGATYEITDLRPDSEGWVVLALAEARGADE